MLETHPLLHGQIITITWPGLCQFPLLIFFWGGHFELFQGHILCRSLLVSKTYIYQKICPLRMEVCFLRAPFAKHSFGIYVVPIDGLVRWLKMRRCDPARARPASRCVNEGTVHKPSADDATLTYVKGSTKVKPNLLNSHFWLICLKTGFMYSVIFY